MNIISSKYVNTFIKYRKYKKYFQTLAQLVIVNISTKYYNLDEDIKTIYLYIHIQLHKVHVHDEHDSSLSPLLKIDFNGSKNNTIHTKIKISLETQCKYL